MMTQHNGRMTSTPRRTSPIVMEDLACVWDSGRDVEFGLSVDRREDGSHIEDGGGRYGRGEG
jgi:hypothetical protein